MGGARDFPEPSLAYRWIKANVYGAALVTAAGLITTTVAGMLAVSDPDTAIATAAAHVAVGSIVFAYAVAVAGRLTGGVLSRKLPLFPIRTWIALHAIIGLALGVLGTLAGMLPREDGPAPLESWAAAAILVIGVAIVGAVYGAALGSLDALVMRKVARGLRTWIGYSALAETTLGLHMLGLIVGPQTSPASDIIDSGVGLITMIMAATLMLPAVRRLQPRQATPAPDAPPPP